MMLSKELLGAVLNEDVAEIQILESQSSFGSKQLWVTSSSHDCVVNIYELADKCKEWAFKLHFDFEVIRIKREKNYGKIFVRIHTISTNQVNGKEFYPFDTEPEAIFEACDYILKELSNK